MAKKAIIPSVAGLIGGAGSLKFGQDSIFWNGAEFVRDAYVDATRIDKITLGFRTFREPLAKTLDEVVLPGIRQNFAAQGRPAWVQLKASTIAKRQKSMSRGQKPAKAIRMLDETGRLKKAATQKNMWEIKNDQLIFRSTFFAGKVPYGPFQQLGTRKMISRVFISLSGYSEEAEIQTIFLDWMMEKVHKGWSAEVILE
jgi:phage gpG-like protein